MKININIDQFVMDTKKREWYWNYKRRHKIAYFINRLEWYVYPILRYVPKFPIHVDFETSALCNMRCPMCFRPHRIDKNDGLMNFDLYKKAIDECSRMRLYSIRLSWRGESTIHPKLIEMIRYAKDKGIKEVSFLTNALKIEGKYAEELVKSGVDYLSISVDGLYEDYDNIRKPAKFEDTIERIRNLRKLRDAVGNGYPLLKVNTIWDKVKERSAEYYSVFSPFVDIISFNPDYDYSETHVEIDQNHICQYTYQRLTVKWNGDVPMCISDWDSEVVLGNLKTDTLYEIWHGEKLSEIRRLHKQGRIRELPPCRKCHRPVTVQVGNQRDMAVAKEEKVG